MTQTSLYSCRKRLEAGNFGFRKKRNCTVCVAKTKALISFTVTANCLLFLPKQIVGFPMQGLISYSLHHIIFYLIVGQIHFIK